MAVTIPVLGGTTLTQVNHSDGYSEQLEYRGQDVLMASGALATDLVVSAAKRKFELKWKGLTEAQVASVETAFATVKIASTSFTSPRGGSFTVTRDLGANALDIRWYGGGGYIRADVTIRLREV